MGIRNNKNLIRFDWAIKRLLRNKADFSVLEGFLSELMKEDVQIQSILESEGNQRNSTDKYNRVDILVKNSKGELVIIEIQSQTEFDYFHRMVYGTSKAVTEYIEAGEPYENVKKVYSVNIVYFDLGQGVDYIYHGQTDFIGMHKADKLKLSARQSKMLGGKKDPSAIFPEYYVIKVNQFDDVAKDTLDQWIYYLKNNDIKEDFTAKGISKAREIWRLDTLPEDERRSYNRHLKHLMDEASSIRSQKIEAEYRKDRENKMRKREDRLKQDEEKLKQEEDRLKQDEEKLKQKEEDVNRMLTKAQQEIVEAKRKMAKELKDEGVDVAIIQKSTGLSKEEIDAL
ncbi:MAG: Rpn family recombination-promoting nuclease/putative transposase [Bacteroidales bacterium]